MCVYKSILYVFPSAFTADGEQHWNLATIPFNSQVKFRYVFYGVRGDPANSMGGIKLDDVTLTETGCPAGIWQIKNFSSVLNSSSIGDTIGSPVFHNSEGYCFILKLYPRGLPSSVGNYLAIRFALCSSQNDHALEWPAGNRQVTFTIVDQNPDITQRMSSSRSFTTDPELTVGSKFKVHVAMSMSKLV